MPVKLPEEMSLAELAEMEQWAPDLAAFAKLTLATTFDQFVDALNQDIDQGVRLMEDDPGVRINDGEDRLTADLLTFLTGRGYDVTHDEKIGGHCDLVVKHRRQSFRWLGEAKVHKNDYGYLRQGFDQLCTRYARGTPDSPQGGLIIYIRQPKASSVVSTWRSKLTGAGLEEFAHRDCSRRPGLSFFSCHTHKTSGLPYTVRHIGVVLHFNPEDRR